MISPQGLDLLYPPYQSFQIAAAVAQSNGLGVSSSKTIFGFLVYPRSTHGIMISVTERVGHQFQVLVIMRRQLVLFQEVHKVPAEPIFTPVSFVVSKAAEDKLIWFELLGILKEAFHNGVRMEGHNPFL